jgi:hypothetical protein
VAEGVAGEGAVAGSLQVVPQFPERAAGDADAGGVEQFREEGEHVEAHGCVPVWPGRKGTDEKDGPGPSCIKGAATLEGSMDLNVFATHGKEGLTLGVIATLILKIIRMVSFFTR